MLLLQNLPTDDWTDGEVGFLVVIVVVVVVVVVVVAGPDATTTEPSN